MDVLKKIAKNWRNFPEPVQLIYVITFSICIVPKDKIYIDKVIYELFLPTLYSFFKLLVK